MTNQMKKILNVCLILSYISFGGLLVLWLGVGFAFNYAFSYVTMIISAILCVYFQFLKHKINQQDKEFIKQIFYAKKLLELREGAKLKFYLDRGIEPRYNEDGTVMDPDEFIGIVTRLDEKGLLEKSIYEILGIEPQFDKDGKEIPVIVVLKHLMKKPRMSNFEALKGISKKMVAKGTEKAKDGQKQEKKPEKGKESSVAKASSGSKSKQKPIVIYREPRGKGDGKSSSKSNQGKKTDEKSNSNPTTEGTGVVTPTRPEPEMPQKIQGTEMQTRPAPISRSVPEPENEPPRQGNLDKNNNMDEVVME